ncbi:MAG: hypothetical protein OXT69_00680 [Candidatus Poribacteria bacterium]|nr:hypothetical protein [Candidatus Poribacteria bacterium]
MKIDAPAPRLTEIPLADESRPHCKVAAPDKPNWSQLAHRFCVRVREYTRTEPAQVVPEELTDDDFSHFHLVLFGSILDNPAILKLYQRSLCFTDAAYPGPRGVEIRALSNPLGLGKNVLLIGGSDYQQTHEAIIGLHRSFSQVTVERGETLYLRRLNFCVSEKNQRALPSAAELERIRQTVGSDPDSQIGRAVDALFYHYQTDQSAWAELARRLLDDALNSPLSAENAWKLALAWTLVQDSPYFDDPFRLQIDRALLSAGSAAANAFEPVRPLTQAACAQAMAVVHIGSHLNRLYGQNPFQQHEKAVERIFNTKDPDTRDPAVLDIWMTYLLRTENYERLDEAPLNEMAQSILADADNEKRHLTGEQAAPHAQNLLSKIAAFTDDGKPLWLRRWLETDEVNIAASWTTSPYTPDRIPEEPRNIPRISAVPAPEGKTARAALRQDLSPNSEYLSVGAEINRLSWRGRAWLKADAWTDEPGGGRLLRKADLSDFAYMRLAFETWTRRVFWRFDRYILIADEWTGEQRPASLTRLCEPTDPDAVFEKTGHEWAVQSGPSRLRVCALDGQAPDEWQAEDAVHALLFTIDPNLQLERGGANRFRAGDERCAFGAFNERGTFMDADAFSVSEDGMQCVGFRELRVNGKTELRAEEPIDFQVEWASGDGTLHVETLAAVHWEDESQRLEPGEYRASFHNFDWSAFRQF